MTIKEEEVRKMKRFTFTLYTSVDAESEEDVYNIIKDKTIDQLNNGRNTEVEEEPKI